MAPLVLTGEEKSFLNKIAGIFLENVPKKGVNGVSIFVP